MAVDHGVFNGGAVLKQGVADDGVAAQTLHGLADTAVEQIERRQAVVQRLRGLCSGVVRHAETENLQKHRRADEQRHQRDDQKSGKELPAEGA